MLWSMTKIIVFVAAVAALAWGAGYLLESTGGLQITVMGEEYTFGPLQSVIGIVLLFLVVWVIERVFGMLMATLKFINGDETAYSRFWDRRAERKGVDALSDAMMALAAGEGGKALAKAQKADGYLNRPALTNLLTAQAAEMAGDKRKAEETYRKMVEDQQTRFVGVRGILKQKLAEGDTETALGLAERAFALRPKHAEVGDTLLQLQAAKEDWSGARKTLNTKLKNGQLPRDVHKRRDAVLALSEARDLLADGKEAEARDAAIEANRLSPDLIPAAAMAAEAYIKQGKPRYASKVLVKAWSVQPHPDLAAAFAAIEPEEAPAARIKRFATLTRGTEDNPETKMLKAELHLADEDFPAARRALSNLVETEPTARSVTLMAAIERGEGADDSVVKGWLARALTAPRGPQWVCDDCQHVYASWQPVCDICGGFDTLSWRSPPASDVALPSGVQMLPLIVGAPETSGSEIVEADGADIEGEATVEEAAEKPTEEASAKAS